MIRWYQYQDINAWCGPLLVVTHTGNTVFVQTSGKFADIEKDIVGAKYLKVKKSVFS